MDNSSRRMVDTYLGGIRCVKIAKHLLEGIKLLALFGAVALVVWTMPDRDIEHTEAHVSQSKLSSH